MFGTIGIIGSRPADLDAALAEVERLNVELATMRCNELALEQLKATIAERDDLAARLAEVEKRTDGEIGSYKYMVDELRARIAELECWPPASQRQVANLARAASAYEMLSDFWNCPVGEALPVTTAANTPPSPAGPCVRQPSDDLTIPPVPFNALRWSR